MKTFDLYKLGEKYTIQLEVCTYRNGNLAISMILLKNGMPEPWNTLTVNLDGMRKRDCAFIDTNNNGNEIIKWIAKHKLAVPTGFFQQSGFCIYPEYRFLPEVLEQIDAEGYTAYLSGQK